MSYIKIFPRIVAVLLVSCLGLETSVADAIQFKSPRPFSSTKSHAVISFEEQALQAELITSEKHAIEAIGLSSRMQRMIETARSGRILSLPTRWNFALKTIVGLFVTTPSLLGMPRDWRLHSIPYEYRHIVEFVIIISALLISSFLITVLWIRLWHLIQFALIKWSLQRARDYKDYERIEKFLPRLGNGFPPYEMKLIRLRRF